MRTIRSAALLLAVSLPLHAQAIRQMTRVTPTAGFADSTLFACTDSTQVFARACKFSDLQKRLAFKTWDSLKVTGPLRGVADSATGSVRAQTLTSPRTIWGQSFNGSAAISGGITAVTNITGGANSMTILAGTGASRQLTLQTTTSGSAATTALRFNELQQSLAANGLVGSPSLSFASDSTLGFYRHGTLGANDTLSLAINGSNSLHILGQAAVTLAGGAGSMTIQAGTGNGRTLTLQSVNSSGVALNTLVLGTDTISTFLGRLKIADGTVASPAFQFTSNGSGMYFVPAVGPSISAGGSRAVTWGVDSASNIFGALKGSGTGLDSIVGGAGSMTIVAGTGNSRSMLLQATSSTGVTNTFLTGASDTLKFGGHAIATGFTTAAGTPGTICYNTVTSELTKNAATSCVVSSIRFKSNVQPLALDSAVNIVSRLTPVTYTMKDGGRPSIHVIAEQADSISKRLSFYDAEGRINSVDDGAILSALLRVVQDQGRQLDSLKAALRRGKP